MHARFSIRIGGRSARDLLEALEAGGIGLNAAAHEILSSPRFAMLAAVRTIATVETSVAALGFEGGATMPAILESAAQRGWGPCPPETAPHLRLQYLDQPEGAAGVVQTSGRAPPGSLTVVSNPLHDDPVFPRGFYLRRIEGTPWLRGYRSDDEHVWAPEDRLLFLDGPAPDPRPAPRAGIQRRRERSQ